MAKTIGYDDVAALLHKNLDDERNADETLTKIASGGINEEAVKEPAETN